MNKTEEKGKNLYKPKDREGGFPSDMPYIQRRFFETIPGIFTWTLLLLPVIFALLRWEIALVVYISFLVAYWLFRTIKFAIGAYIGVRRMEEEKQIDWVGKIKELNSDKFSDLRYIYLCPVYGESLEILEPSFKAWSESDIGAKKIDVVVAMEEAKKDLQIENFNTLKQKYGNKFGSMRYYIHPAGIPGEIIGVKGANINYAARELVKDLEKKERRFLIT